MPIFTTDMILGKKEKEELTKLAGQYGWQVANTSPMSFKKNNTMVWYCKNFWQCADMVHGQFYGHRQYKDVESAFKNEK